MLHDEDAEAELQLFLIELIHKIPLSLLQNNNDGKIVNYITTAISNHYKLLVSKIIKEKCSLPLSSFSEEQQENIQNALYIVDDLQIDLTELLQKVLTKNELEVVTFKYLGQYTIQEIADYKKVSRQAINQTHNNALKKIKKYLK